MILPPRDIPRIPWREIEPLYIIDYYDRPLSGRCRWGQIDGLYEIIDDGTRYPLSYAWYEFRRPAADVLAEEDRRRALFHQLVCDWRNPDWRRVMTGYRGDDSVAEYRALSETWEPLNLDGERVGWFSLTPHFQHPRSWAYWERLTPVLVP